MRIAAPHTRRFSRIWTTDPLRRDARNRADRIVATDPDNQELRARYAAAGTIEHETELTVGLNVRLIGQNLKLANDVSWLRDIDNTPNTRNDYRLRVQLQFAF